MARTIQDVLSELSKDWRGRGNAGEGAYRSFESGGWDEIAEWAPDTFALTSVLLSESGAYRLAVSPPVDKRWPRPGGTWRDHVDEHAQQWWRWIAEGCSQANKPSWLSERIAQVSQATQTPIASIADDWDLACTLLELHVVADEACAGFGLPPHPGDGRHGDSWAEHRLRANDLLAERDTLSTFSREVVQVLPKMRTPQTGISLRSLSAHLAVTRFDEVDICWAHTAAFSHDKSSFNLLMVPLPFRVDSSDFKPVRGSLDNMDTQRFGFFQFKPKPLDLNLVECVLRRAMRLPGGVDGIVFPELAISEAELTEVKDALERICPGVDHRVPFILAGVRGARENRAHFAVRIGPSQWRDYLQAKHHRWCLDRTQIETYRLGGALHPSVRWWEDIQISRRQVRFIVANSWLGICPLVCEDLARQDPVSQIVRAVGPTLVLALLLDGPQLSGRWSARYATVLADDPGSSVLTFTALGMAERSVPPGAAAKRTVGLWKDARFGLQELNLAPGAAALLITLCNEWVQEWLADGRSDGGTAAQLYLGHVEQVAVDSDGGRVLE